MKINSSLWGYEEDFKLLGSDYVDIISGFDSEGKVEGNQSFLEQEAKVTLLTSRKIEFLSFFVISIVCDILNCATVATILQLKRIR